MTSFADRPCHVCQSLFPEAFQNWTWVHDPKTNFQFRLCPSCVRLGEQAFHQLLEAQVMEDGPDKLQMVLLYMAENKSVGSVSELFAKRRKVNI